MNQFALLYQSLDQAIGTKAREHALQRYFSEVSSAEASWAIFVISGGKTNTGRNRIANTTQLRAWLGELVKLPHWMVDDCYRQVGDLGETLALLVEAQREQVQMECVQFQGQANWQVPHNDSTLLQWIEGFLLPLVHEPETVRKQAIQSAWLQLDAWPRFVLNKLLTGSLRVGVSKRMLQTSLAPLAGISSADMAHRLIGEWMPTPAAYDALMHPDTSALVLNKPYPFYLASPLQDDLSSLGLESEWQAEWKWDGIRVQLVRREGVPAYLWSRGEERLDGRFPELEMQALHLPVGVVLDGELLAWDAENATPRPFVALQKRIQKRSPSPKLQKQVPVHILFYDLLELDGIDWRNRPLQMRRQALVDLLSSMSTPQLKISPEVEFERWEELHGLRELSGSRNAEGLMLKQRCAPYLEGRRRGAWWKWKVDPYSIDAVLIYAQSGSGRRSTLHSDYTFAVWNDTGALVPIAKAYSGLTDAELKSMDKWIRSHTIERFGPVRSVQPEKVFEIAFEAVNRSSRHKSGVAVRFPRIVRMRDDKTAAQADHLSALLALCKD
ncbi:ATP-dependent DNA ligase [Comamonas sp. Y33R10-2]|uniref:ATP-dependent DNA ligase n=1 Tax=Comamonas sp. Y33R10-2 TaxID=2853257 RepID=UPI001C5C926E|nr:ATP-dependent DNA ligase [Comamonas sp. Y33R10-2]QXZ09516.1 ATP-dependent DNA ligase [Comamonas sp. Y33R10-2]